MGDLPELRINKSLISNMTSIEIIEILDSLILLIEKNKNAVSVIDELAKKYLQIGNSLDNLTINNEDSSFISSLLKVL